MKSMDFVRECGALRLAGKLNLAFGGGAMVHFCGPLKVWRVELCRANCPWFELPAGEPTDMYVYSVSCNACINTSNELCPFNR